MGGVQARMESVLARLLPAAHVAPARLHEAMRYATLEGGKRVRPLLAFAAGEVGRAAPERLEVAAAAVELIHAYSLVHDDLPCMDDDVLRRGKPTVHVEYDEATALLVGDALQSLAFQLLSEHRLADEPSVQLEMLKTLAMAAGSRGMAGGQQHRPRGHRQGAHASRARVHAHPQDRGADQGCSAPGLVPAEGFRKRRGRSWTSTPKPSASRSRWSTTCSTPTASTATLGKTAGKDSKQGKPTYVSALGLPRARQLAEELRGEAHAALSGIGAPARRLGEARRLHRSEKILAMASIIRRAARRRRQAHELRAAQDHRRAGAAARARAQAARPARRRAARLRARVGVEDRRAPVVQPRHGGAHHRAALRLRHARGPHRLGRRPPDLPAQDPHRAARGDGAAAHARRHLGLSAARRIEVRHLRHRAFVDFHLRRAGNGRCVKNKKREAGAASR